MGLFESRTVKERKSHFKNLVMVALADGTLADNERNLLASIGTRIGLSQEEVTEVLSKPDKIKLKVPSSQEAKVSQMVDLVAMMMVDGNVDAKEFVLCMALAKEMGLDPGIVKVIADKMLEALEKGLSSDSAVNDITSILA